MTEMDITNALLALINVNDIRAVDVTRNKGFLGFDCITRNDVYSFNADIADGMKILESFMSNMAIAIRMY